MLYIRFQCECERKKEIRRLFNKDGSGSNLFGRNATARLCFCFYFAYFDVSLTAQNMIRETIFAEMRYIYKKMLHTVDVNKKRKENGCEIKWLVMELCVANLWNQKHFHFSHFGLRLSSNRKQIVKKKRRKKITKRKRNVFKLTMFKIVFILLHLVNFRLYFTFC